MRRSFLLSGPFTRTAFQSNRHLVSFLGRRKQFCGGGGGDCCVVGESGMSNFVGHSSHLMYVEIVNSRELRITKG